MMLKHIRNKPLTLMAWLAISFPLLSAASATEQSLQPEPTTIPKIDAVIRTEVIEGAIKSLNDSYVFPEVAKRMEQAIRERIARKEYDQITNGDDFARTLTAHLQEVSHDKHLRVLLSAGSRFGANPEQQRIMSIKRNFGFEKVERLSGNIGYLDLRGFEPTGPANHTATAAMNFLANTDALIFDLRQNGGGSPEMVAFLSSYLFDKRTHLSDIYNRPNNSTREFWTQETTPGNRYGNKPVFVLTSNRTFSAAEEFSYNLKNLKRATIIGETTGGGAHLLQPRPLGKMFVITVPFARSINPITKTNWEGTGVKPDIEVSAEKALKVAHLAALKSIQHGITEPQSANQMRTLIEELQKEVGDISLPAIPHSQGSQMPPSMQLLPTVSATSGQITDSDAEIKLPDTPAGRTLGKFIRAFNSGDLAMMKRFHKETGGDEENAEKDLSFFLESGGLKLHNIISSSDSAITVLARTRKDGRWINFSIAVEQQAPHAVTKIDVRPGESPEEKTQERRAAAPPSTGKMSEPELLHQVGVLIDKAIANDGFSGVVMIAKEGNPVFKRAVGLASKSYSVPNRIDTKFNLGSINKIFTQIAIMQLVEAGKLSLEDKIGKHLPDYPNKEVAEKVTINHLVNMQSGIGDFFGPKFEATPKNRIRRINDYLSLFADQPLKFEPGTSRSYSNGGYIVLGAIIEKVSGQSYFDYVREQIFKPSGMGNTDSYEVDAIVQNLATGYTRRGNAEGKQVSNIYTKPARGSSAGGGYSTAEDLLKFSLALQNNKLLNAENSRKFGKLGIAGGAPGINATFEVGGKSEYTIIVLSNYDPPSAEDLNEKIRKLIKSN